MSMSDCPKCWDTPCTCGYEYESWSIGAINGLIRVLEGVKAKKLKKVNLFGLKGLKKADLFGKNEKNRAK